MLNDCSASHIGTPTESEPCVSLDTSSAQQQQQLLSSGKRPRGRPPKHRREHGHRLTPIQPPSGCSPTQPPDKTAIIHFSSTTNNKTPPSTDSGDKRSSVSSLTTTTTASSSPVHAAAGGHSSYCGGTQRATDQSSPSSSSGGGVATIMPTTTITPPLPRVRQIAPRPSSPAAASTKPSMRVAALLFPDRPGSATPVSKRSKKRLLSPTSSPVVEKSAAKKPARRGHSVVASSKRATNPPIPDGNNVARVPVAVSDSIDGGAPDARANHRPSSSSKKCTKSSSPSELPPAGAADGGGGGIGDPAVSQVRTQAELAASLARERLRSKYAGNNNGDTENPRIGPRIVYLDVGCLCVC